ncbi:hypothetical protein COU96_01455 [Candidatus Shapirobacteria bacterium CG10_big_fil_rev_8_21_14_0_10_38_14]|uniref:Uncharacterized protein n=1 Tax=Candidatus Shapirobacteria bacterium CG10_big_fil_rev_8_21_14_0_10_38_14 TaxID=1974483 RepID=A0A2M8L5P3_9BACT|nr:MAG: hypothetical protein COU96_01455 [Candidatus Shapirobacteria bacterium CG10_big_fil_rev_8_21_14_0_10_38_14]
MLNLTQTSFYVRRGLKISGILLVAFLITRAAFKISSQLWKKAHPEPPPPPTVTFGKLPKLIFPNQLADLPKISYKLETIQGSLPSLPDVGKVYFMPKKGPNLLALDRAKQQARKMGFRNEPETVSETTYRWTSQGEPATVMEMDINYGNFHLKYDYNNDPEILVDKNLPTNQQAAQEAKTFLVNNGFLTDDLNQGTAEFEYLCFEPPNLNPVLSFSEASFVQANLFRADLDELKILPPNPKKANISFLFSGSRTPGKRILEINYTYFPIEKETFATYPLKSTNQAWSELQADKGYIAYLGQNQNGQVTIRKVYLAFYDSFEPQHYLQPIFVFEGDRNFFAYVPAIDLKWTD